MLQHTEPREYDKFSSQSSSSYRGIAFRSLPSTQTSVFQLLRGPRDILFLEHLFCTIGMFALHRSCNKIHIARKAQEPKQHPAKRDLWGTKISVSSTRRVRRTRCFGLSFMSTSFLSCSCAVARSPSRSFRTSTCSTMQTTETNQSKVGFSENYFLNPTRAKESKLWSLAKIHSLDSLEALVLPKFTFSGRPDPGFPNYPALYYPP